MLHTFILIDVRVYIAAPALAASTIDKKLQIHSYVCILLNSKRLVSSFDVSYQPIVPTVGVLLAVGIAV